MAITLLGSGSNSVGATSSNLTTSYSSHSGTYRKLIVMVDAKYATSATDQIDGVTYNGTALALLYEKQTKGTSPYGWFTIWYLDDADFPAAGAHNLIVQIGTVDNLIMTCEELSGATQGILDYAENYSGVSQYNNTSVATTIDNTWLVSGIQCTGNAYDVSPTSGQTETADVNLGLVADNSLAMAYHNIETATETADNNWDYGSGNTPNTWQFIVTVPPVISQAANSAILAATF